MARAYLLPRTKAKKTIKDHAMRAQKHQAIMHKKRKEKNDTWHDDTEKSDPKIAHSSTTSKEVTARTRKETLSPKDFPIKENTF